MNLQNLIKMLKQITSFVFLSLFCLLASAQTEITICPGEGVSLEGYEMGVSCNCLPPGQGPPGPCVTSVSGDPIWINNTTGEQFHVQDLTVYPTETWSLTYYTQSADCPELYFGVIEPSVPTGPTDNYLIIVDENCGDCTTVGNACDDLSESTYNDVINEDCVCVGTPCPAQGSSCDDGDPITTNDVEDGNCNCAGSCPDEGTPCDDGFANTYDDNYDNDCNCFGTFCPAVGTACNDGNPNNYNDVEDGFCNCFGSDSPCPAIGTPCDDGNSNTDFDIEDGNCECVGLSSSRVLTICQGDVVSLNAQGPAGSCPFVGGPRYPSWIVNGENLGIESVLEVSPPVSTLYYSIVSTVNCGPQFPGDTGPYVTSQGSTRIYFVMIDPACAGCPSFGFSCNDGLSTTSDDTINSECECVGTPCPAEGTACDDGNEFTINDVENGSCLCLGEYEDNGTFPDYPFLNAVIDLEDCCANASATLYQNGSSSYVYVAPNSNCGVPNSGKLYATNGQLYCSDAAGFSCLNTYGLSGNSTAVIWECGAVDCDCDDVYDPVCGVDGNTYPNACEANCIGVEIASMGECSTGGGAENFEDYQWLYDVVDLNDCCSNATVTAYASGIFTYIHIAADPNCNAENSGVLYFENGQFYCSDSPGFSCVEAYGLSAVNTEILYDCSGPIGCICNDVYDPVCGVDGNTYPNACEAMCAGVDVASEGICSNGGEPNFEDYPWLNDVVDLNDCCSNASVTAYASGSFTYIHVAADPTCNAETSGVLYFQNGQYYCSDAAGFSCVEAYGLSSMESEVLYSCTGLVAPCGCLDIYDPVCGVDGNVYDNDCLAFCAGVAIDESGLCFPDAPDFGEFNWLLDIVDLASCCDNNVITAYQTGIFTYLYIESDPDCGPVTGTLYFQNGQMYCSDAAGFSCVDAYGLNEMNSMVLWDCGTIDSPIVPNDVDWSQNELDNTVNKRSESELFELNEVKVYPNPSNGIINVDLQKAKVSSVKLYDLTGRLIEDRMVDEFANSIQLELYDFPNGIYFIEINSGNEKQTKKIILEK